MFAKPIKSSHPPMETRLWLQPDAERPDEWLAASLVSRDGAHVEALTDAGARTVVPAERTAPRRVHGRADQQARRERQQ